MKKKTIIAIAALLAMGQGAWAEYPPTIESISYDNEHGYYPISSVDNLNDLAKYVNAGNDCSGLIFKLTTDLDYSVDENKDGTPDYTFTPIGIGAEWYNPPTPFKGAFDGDNKTISGITYTDPVGVGIGLFGFISYPAVIKNIKLVNCSFTGNFEVGAIVGASYGTGNENYGIFNCTVGSDVKVTAATATIDNQEITGAFAGGIIGECSDMTLSGCISAAQVTGDEYVGGITGRFKGSTGDGGKSIIEYCYFTGSVTGNDHKGNILGARGYISDNDGEEATTTNGTINLDLSDDDSDETIKNATRIANYNGLEVNVKLSGRTLYKDGHWNTLCLPFDASLTGDFAGAEIRTLSTATFSEGTLTLNFTPASGEGAVTSIEAGKPYIIKWTSGSSFTPTFTGVTINSADPTDVTGTAANFHGIYTPYSTGGENKSMLYLGASNTLYYPNANMTINAFRAYFTLNNGIEAGTPNNQTTNAVRAFVLNFGDEQTGIVSLSADSKHLKDCAAWYTPGGVRLDGKPSRAGVYINNGKKVVIK